MKNFWKIFALCVCVIAVMVSAALAAANIGEAKAKKIATEHAMVKQADVQAMRVKMDTENGKLVYDVEFYAKNAKYDYEIDAASGTILKHEMKAQANSGAAAASGITPEQAKKTALARVPGATEKDIVEFKLDRDDGRQEYEGKIFYNGVEYEFEINAQSGKITSWEEDRD